MGWCVVKRTALFLWPHPHADMAEEDDLNDCFTVAIRMFF